MPKSWPEQIASLADKYPLRSRDPQDASLALAIDEGISEKLLSARGDRDVAGNPLYVESLLQDSINRISNCLTLREKAQDIEERAVYSALNHKLQDQSIETQRAVAQMFDNYNAQMLQYATSAELKDQKVTFQGPDADHWNVAIISRQALEAVQLERNTILKQKSSVPGNAANYVERFTFLKKLFDLNVVEAYRRALVVESALHDIYGITATVPNITPVGFLNDLAVWAQKTSDMLDRELDSRYIGRIGLALASDTEIPSATQLIPKTAYGSMLTQQRSTFTLTSNPFEAAGMNNVLLRSIKVHIEGADHLNINAWPVSLKLPARDGNGKVEQFSTIATSSQADLADAEGVVKGVHNINPRGEWELKISPRALSGVVTDVAQVKNIYLILTISYRRV